MFGHNNQYKKKLEVASNLSFLSFSKVKTYLAILLSTICIGSMHATIPVNFNLIKEEVQNSLLKSDIMQISYELIPEKDPTSTHNEEQKSSIEERKSECRSYLFLKSEGHVGESLVTDLGTRGGGTIIRLSYSLVTKHDDSSINNQATKPSIGGKEIKYPLICEKCYKILTILYPNIKNNKLIQWDKQGCDQAPSELFKDYDNLNCSLPDLATKVKTHLPREKVNSLLESIGLMTIDYSNLLNDFALNCYKGDVDNAMLSFPAIQEHGIHNAEISNNMFLGCVKSKGFLAVIKFLVEKEKAAMNYIADQELPSPLMAALIDYHEDTWNYLIYMLEHQYQHFSLYFTNEITHSSFFDLLFRYLEQPSVTNKDVMKIARLLLGKGLEKSRKEYQKYVNELLFTCCQHPGFLEVIMELVESEGGDVNYKGLDGLSVLMRTLKYPHTDSLNYFEYFFQTRKHKIICTERLLKEDQVITLFDLLFDYAIGEHKNKVIKMVTFLIQNPNIEGWASNAITIPEAKKILASYALLASSCFAGLTDFVKFLVEKMGADINHTDGFMTPAMRAMKMAHEDAFNYLAYMIETGHLEGCMLFQHQNSVVSLFDLMVTSTLQHNAHQKVLPLIKNLYQKRKKIDNSKKLKKLVTLVLLAFCDIPGFLDLVKFCVKNGADINYTKKHMGPIIPLKVIMSTKMLLPREQQGQGLVYYQDVFPYLTCMLSVANVHHSRILKDDNGTSFTFLQILMVSIRKKNKQKIVKVIQILNEHSPITKGHLSYLQKRGVINSDNNSVFKMIRNMVKNRKTKKVGNNHKGTRNNRKQPKKGGIGKRRK